MAALLTPAERDAALPALGDTGWAAIPDTDAIRKVWAFPSFVEAWGFMTRAALHAQALDHHPDWRNAYNVVDVTLTTHDCHGLSALDLDLARRMDRLAGDTPVRRDHGEPIRCLCEERAARD